MARMRSIKPEFFADQDLAEELPNRDARLLYIGLWGLADEHGRLRGDARSIKGQLFAYDDDLTPSVIDGLIDMLAQSGRAVRYRVEKATYLFLPKLAQHQRLEPGKTPSRLPEPPVELVEPSTIGLSEKIPDESADDPEEFAPKHVASSKEHEAGSREQSAESHGLVALPIGAETSAQLVIDNAGVTPELAVEVVLAIAAERKPRNLVGLVRSIVAADDLGQWVAKAERTQRSSSGSSAPARASPCERHPWESGNCAVCRSELIGRAD